MLWPPSICCQSMDPGFVNSVIDVRGSLKLPVVVRLEVSRRQYAPDQSRRRLTARQAATGLTAKWISLTPTITRHHDGRGKRTDWDLQMQNLQ